MTSISERFISSEILRSSGSMPSSIRSVKLSDGLSTGRLILSDDVGADHRLEHVQLHVTHAADGDGTAHSRDLGGDHRLARGPEVENPVPGLVVLGELQLAKAERGPEPSKRRMSLSDLCAGGGDDVADAPHTIVSCAVSSANLSGAEVREAGELRHFLGEGLGKALGRIKAGRRPRSRPARGAPHTRQNTFDAIADLRRIAGEFLRASGACVQGACGRS